ncbi:BLUF domain-containing protein [Rhodobacteraceae bacterium 2376]|uniref:BLUF domain-containing protein n=1 Tax=Rhabdonatronobacter sediminivivens TaxID=2743469 RepID=A0A7Z0I1T8_9RHOB|nr:BLUF domain-containing protein [Rhabdonatronobacter sediminivivens]NYS26260.1 BLUF domain-containing protein [Rhabdonatronobacter sediminivivens]
MRRITYISAAKGLLSQDEIRKILEVSRRNNQRDGISGMLAYHDGSFFQVIEGPEPEIDALLRRIARDPRHSAILQLLSAEVSSRAFPEWRMAYVDLSQAPDTPGIVQLRQIAQEAQTLTEDRRINTLLASFVRGFRDLATDHAMP